MKERLLSVSWVGTPAFIIPTAAAVRTQLRDGSACGERRAVLPQRHPLYISGTGTYTHGRYLSILI